MIPAIVIGSEHHNTLSIVRDIGENRIPVILILYGAYDTYISTSVYISRLCRVSSASLTLDALKEVLKELPFKPVVITCSDESASVLDNAYEELKGKCFFFNAGESGRITSYMDKNVQAKMASKYAFKVPKTIESTSGDIDVDNIHYPCLIKPKESIHGGKNFHICRNIDDLNHNVSFFDPKQPIIIQDFIEKDYEIVILGVSVCGKHVVPGYVKKHRDYKGGTTYCTSYPSKTLPPKIVESCIALLTDINYTGLWGIECIVKGSSFYFIELNLRNDATSYVLTKAGFDMPYYFYNAFIHDKNTANDLKNLKVRQIDSMVEFEDFNFVLKFKVGLFDWLKQKGNCECLYYKSENDPVPYQNKRKEYLRFLRKRILRF